MIPLYVKIAEQLRKQILNGDLSPDTRLPTQRELAEEFSTTLMTVRQALEVLEEENLIRTEHGIGSFVVSPRLEENDFNLLGFSNEMSRRALTIETRLISLVYEARSPQACQALAQPEGSPLICLERLRLLAGKPLVYQHSYLPARFEPILRQYNPGTSLYQHLHQHGGLILTAAREILKPVLLNPAQAAWLQRPERDPALLSLRLSFHQDGLPVLFDEALLAADSVVVATERYGLRTGYQFHILDSGSPDPLTLLNENE
jgi:GntR family transcriptional regulator